MIVGFTGLAGSGKDTAAKYLVEKYGFERHAFADKLKDAVAALMFIPREDVDIFKEVVTDYGACRASVLLLIDNECEYEFQWREFLQRFGTEMGRQVFGNDFWVNQLMSGYAVTDWAISDVRFENEASAIQDAGGVVVKLIRPGTDVGDTHVSEAGLYDDSIDHVILNDGSLSDLYRSLDQLLQHERY